ncbi:InlB B-repeat-containing protein [Cerasicoccus maritimus]|uniref:InlB B-repeat-containing protein n=1 Tax=Cerasicoccus maritimus TaxID=490089 RepID=UPI00285252BB|nr:chitobiase/beta-hexosaminidase C-terminal domain-containing protein [Cerasicoccus maritimus]
MILVTIVALGSLAAQTHLHAADSDNDGFTDGIELRHNADPYDPQSYPKSGQLHAWPNVTLPQIDVALISVDADTGQIAGLGINGEVIQLDANGQFVDTSGLPELVEIELGNDFAVGLDAAGGIHAWGSQTSLINATPTGTGYTELSTNTSCAVALHEDGSVVSWGAAAQALPAELEGVTFKAISAGFYFVAGLTTEGEVKVWGLRSGGDLTPPDDLPALVEISAGFSHIIARHADGSITTWGSNSANQLDAPSLGKVLQVDAKLNLSAALNATNEIISWPTDYIADMPTFTEEIIDFSLGSNVICAIEHTGPLVITTPFDSLSPKLGKPFTLYVNAERYDSVAWYKNDELLVGETSLEYTDSAFEGNDSGVYKIVITLGEYTVSQEFQVRGADAPKILLNGQDVSHKSASPGTISLSTTIADGLMFYTTDGTAPNPAKNYYATPFEVTSDALIRARVYTADFSTYLESEPFEVDIVSVHTIRYNGYAGGSMSVSPQQSQYLYGDVVSITANPPTGWSFLRWTGSLAGYPQTAELSVTENIYANPVYGADVGVTILPGGSVTRSQENPVEYNSTLTLTAIPDYGYRFIRWDKNSSAYSASPTISMVINSTGESYRAVFIQLPEVLSTVEVAESPYGSISGAGDYEEEQLATIQATPIPGYVFVDWQGDFAGQPNPFTFEPSGLVEIAATFAQDTRDPDGDTLTNYEEIILYGTLPDNIDSDNDTIRDDYEVALSDYLDPNRQDTALLQFIKDFAPALNLIPKENLIEVRGNLQPYQDQFADSFGLEFWLSESTDLKTWTQAPLERLTYQLKSDGTLIIYLDSDLGQQFVRLHGDAHPE